MPHKSTGNQWSMYHESLAGGRVFSMAPRIMALSSSFLWGVGKFNARDILISDEAVRQWLAHAFGMQIWMPFPSLGDVTAIQFFWQWWWFQRWHCLRCILHTVYNGRLLYWQWIVIESKLLHWCCKWQMKGLPLVICAFLCINTHHVRLSLKEVMDWMHAPSTNGGVFLRAERSLIRLLKNVTLCAHSEKSTLDH